MGTAVEVRTISDLARAVEGRSDNQILQAFAGGYVELLDVVGEAMTRYFLPEKAAGQEALIRYEIKLPEGAHAIQVRVAQGKCELDNAPVAPRVKVGLSFPTFLRLVSGKLNPVQAFFTGKLKVSGDVMLAQRIQSWFRLTD